MGLKEALKVFADAATGIPDSVSDAKPFFYVSQDAKCPGTMTTITVGDMRRAREAFFSSPVEQKALPPFPVRWRLTPTEREILRLLMTQDYVTNDQAQAGAGSGSPQVLRKTVFNLRAKVKKACDEEIGNARGHGYYLTPGAVARIRKMMVTKR